MRGSRARIKTSIYALAGLLLAGLLLLRLLHADQHLVRILAVASALLVALLLITYRAFAGVADAARDGTLGPPPADDDKDER